KIGHELAGDSQPAHVRVAALIALASTEDKKLLGELVSNVLAGDADYQALGTRAIATVPGELGTDMLIQILDANPAPEAQITALSALEGMRAKKAVTAVENATASDDPEVRAAAYQALGAVGGANTVKVLAAAAAGEGDDAKAAQQ